MQCLIVRDDETINVDVDFSVLPPEPSVGIFGKQITIESIRADDGEIECTDAEYCFIADQIEGNLQYE